MSSNSMTSKVNLDNPASDRDPNEAGFKLDLITDSTLLLWRSSLVDTPISVREAQRYSEFQQLAFHSLGTSTSPG